MNKMTTLGTSRLFSLGFALTLQFLPLARFVSTAQLPANSPYVMVLKIFAGAVALLGSYHAVSGASTIITSPGTASGKVGQAFSYRITTAPEAGNAFRIDPVPPALPGQGTNVPAPGLALNTTSGFITGIPSAAGSYTNTMWASDAWKADRITSKRLVITIAANPPPSLVSPPQNQTVVPGANVTFSVTASNSTPMTYRWHFNGNPIFGGTNSTLLLTNVQSIHSGNYQVTVFGLGSSTNASATLTVNGLPGFITQPEDRFGAIGSTVIFTCNVGGMNPLTYRWRFNDQDLPGQTNATLTLTNIQLSHAGRYSVVADNTLGQAQSTPVMLRITFGTTSGSREIFPISKAWKYNATGANLGTAWSDFDYNDAGWSSGSGVLAVESSANTVVYPLIQTTLSLTSPGGAFVTNFYFRTHFTITNRAQIASLNFSSLVDDGAIFYLNGTEIFRTANMPPGPVNSRTFTTSAATEGVYLNSSVTPDLLVAGDNVLAVEVHQSDAVSSDIVFGTSLSATINTPKTAPLILNQPTAQTADVGGTVSFSVVAEGTGPLFYQWFKDGTPLSNATNALLEVNPVSAGDAGNFGVEISNAFASVASLPVQLTINGPPPSPKLISPLTSQSRFIAQFETVPNLKYVVEYNETLGSANWQVLTNVPSSSIVQKAIITDGLSNSAQRYYRVRITP